MVKITNGVSLIIPLFREKKLPQPLFRSIKNLDYPKNKLEVILVAIQSELKLPKNFKTSLIKIKKRIGYGEALNLGIKKSRNELLLLLNPDTAFKKETLELLVVFLNNHPEAGIVAPKVYQLKNPNKISSYDIPGVGYSRFLGRIAKYTAQDLIKVKKPKDVDWISGSIMLIRKNIWKKLRGFDEKYFLYWEDADFCMRTKDLGYKVFLLPESIAYHVGSASIGKENIEKIYYSIRNNRYFLYKYSSFFGKLIFHIENALFIVAKTLRLAIKKDPSSLVFFNAIIDFYRGKKARVNLFF